MSKDRCLSKRVRDGQPRSKSKLLARIDVTAFASVLLALVAMFAIPASVIIDSGVGVDVPKVRHPSLMPHARREDAMIASVLRDGRVFLGSERISPDQLTALIRERIRQGAERKVYIRADKRANYRAVKGVLDGVRSSGVENVAFLVDQRRPNFPN